MVWLSCHRTHLLSVWLDKNSLFTTYPTRSFSLHDLFHIVCLRFFFSPDMNVWSLLLPYCFIRSYFPVYFSFDLSIGIICGIFFLFFILAILYQPYCHLSIHFFSFFKISFCRKQQIWSAPYGADLSHASRYPRSFRSARFSMRDT